MREAGLDPVRGLTLFAGQALGAGCVPRSPVRVPSVLPSFPLLGTARVSGKGAGGGDVGMGVGEHHVIMGEISVQASPDDFHLGRAGPCEAVSSCG